MTAQQITPQYLSIEDAATYLGVNARTLRRRITDGSLRAFRLETGRSKTHGQLRIRLEDLDSLLRPVPAATGDGGRVA